MKLVILLFFISDIISITKKNFFTTSSCRIERNRVISLFCNRPKFFSEDETNKPILKNINLSRSSQNSDDGYRVNKSLSTMSRRSADNAIDEGRVTINDKICKCGDRLYKGDILKLDGKIQNWSHLANAKKKLPLAQNRDRRDFIYLKYWKPLGVTCTSDMSDKTNIVSAGKFDLFPQRLFTVGRLDKDSTGLILITSDGRLNNALLNPLMKKEKVCNFLHIYYVRGC
jgi:23S rRNA-/tRNA-specific pseudouridylate synthase